MWQKEQVNGHPLLVSKKGVSFPSKNLSKVPSRYGEGISSRSLILSNGFPTTSFCSIWEPRKDHRNDSGD